MWTYNKVLEYPVKIKCPNAKLAKFIISQYGGADGELAASLRYLSQRFGMPDQIAKATLNDIGTEELAHLEIVGTIVHQLTEGLSIDEIKAAGLEEYYTDHGVGVYPQAAAGWPFNAAVLAVKGDPIADLQEDLAAEQAQAEKQPESHRKHVVRFLFPALGIGGAHHSGHGDGQARRGEHEKNGEDIIGGVEIGHTRFTDKIRQGDRE